MRGSLVGASRDGEMLGIIPAHAGLTSQWVYSSGKSRDHPRACGAHPRSTRMIQTFTGSSPRMRGSPNPLDMHIFDAGIIPAHAGLTQLILAPIVAGGDHPRACGAHLHPTKVPSW